MKIDVDAAILDENDEPLKDHQGPVTLGYVVRQALLANPPGDDRMEAAQRDALFALWLKVKTEPCGDFTAEEVALMKARVAKCCGTLVAGRSRMLLDAGPAA